MKVKNEIYVIGIICLCFLVVYSSMIFWGLPQKLDPDEYIFVFAAMEMFSPPYFHSGWFGSPAATLIDIMALLYGLTAALGTLVGHYDSVRGFSNSFWLGDGLVQFEIGRIVSVCFASLSLFLLYKTTRKFTSPPFALCAVLLCGFSYQFVYHSALVRMEMLQIFGLLACAYCCIGLIEKNKINHKDNLILGLFFAFSVFSKYPSITFIVPIIYTYLLVSSNAKIAAIKFFAFGCSVLLFSFLISPYFFLDFGGVLSDVIKEGRSTHLSATSSGFWASLSQYYFGTLRQGFGVFALIIGTIGALIMLKNKKGHIIVLSFLSYLVFISSLSLRWDRWIIPLLPFFAILVAIGLHHCLINTNTRSKLWLVFPIIGLLGVHNVTVSTQLIKNRVQNNFTQIVAARWMDKNIPLGSSILVDLYAPQVVATQYLLYERDCKNGLDQLDNSIRQQVKLPLNACETNANLGIETNSNLFQQAVERIQPEYFVRANIYERHVKDITLGNSETTKLSEYELLFQQYTEINTIMPSKELLGTPIHIYKRNP